MSIPLMTPITLRSYTTQLPLKEDLDPGVGGMYASGQQGTGQSIQVTAMVPDSFQTLSWVLFPPDERGHQNIWYKPEGREPECGWAAVEESPDSPIKLENEPTSFLIEKQGTTPDGKPVVTISPVLDLVGDQYNVGVGDGNKLRVLDFPIGPRAEQQDVPVWIVCEAE